MSFQHILNAILLTISHKECLYRLIKISCLSLAAVLTNSALAFEAEDIKNTPSSQHPSGASYSYLVEPTTETGFPGYTNFAAAQAPRAFDYDPGLLPEVAEVIFALRIKHANIDRPFVINLSGNHLLNFTKDGIDVLDTYTKSRYVYKYQTANPNITIGLGVSKGLPRDYKSIIIKEDANGKLYDYAALKRDNITTDKTMLSETLSHPFYEIVGQDGVENEVTIGKAITFYRKVPSHSRHARCVKESMGILKQIQDILGSGSGVCGPKADLDIFTANHQSVADMKLDQPLVQAAFDKGKYNDTLVYHLKELGYRLEVSLDSNGENIVAILASSDHCKRSIMYEVKRRRLKRAPGVDDCFRWANLLISLYMSFKLDFSNINEIVQSVAQNHGIPARFFPGGQYPENSLESRRTLEQVIYEHDDQAADVLQGAAARVGMAAAAAEAVARAAGDPWYFDEQSYHESRMDIQNAIANARADIFILNEEHFKPLPNVVHVLNGELAVKVRNGAQYATTIIYIELVKQNPNIITFFDHHLVAIKQWRVIFSEMIKKRRLPDSIAKAREALEVVKTIINFLYEWREHSDLVISFVEDNHTLVGISLGRIYGRVYHALYEVVSPESMYHRRGSHIGQLDYLRGEVFKHLRTLGVIDSAQLELISLDNAGHDEL